MTRDFLLLLPLVIVGTGAILLMLRSALGKLTLEAASLVSMCVFALAFVAQILSGTIGHVSPYGAVFNGMLMVTDFTRVAGLIILACGFFTSMSSQSYFKENGFATVEYYSLIAFAVCGMLLLTMSQELITAFISLEIMSLSIYVLVGFNRQCVTCAEAVLKYLMLGAFTGAFFTMGTALIYGGLKQHEILWRSVQPLLPMDFCIHLPWWVVPSLLWWPFSLRLPLMRDFAAYTGGTVSIAMPFGLDFIYVETLRTTDAVPHVPDVGFTGTLATDRGRPRAAVALHAGRTRQPTWQAVKAERPEELDYVQARTLPDIELCKERGFAVSLGEWRREIFGVAAPLYRTPSGDCLSVNCGIPSFRFSRRADRARMRAAHPGPRPQHPVAGHERLKETPRRGINKAQRRTNDVAEHGREE